MSDVDFQNGQSAGFTSPFGPHVAGGGAGFYGSGLLSNWNFAITNQALSPSANDVNVCWFYLAPQVEIRKASWLTQTQGGAGKVAVFGLYDYQGNLLTQASFDANGSTSVAQSVSLSNILALNPGWYFFAWASDSTTTMSGVNSAATNTGVNPFTKNVARCGKAANSMASGNLPSTLGTITAGNRQTPIVFFEA